MTEFIAALTALWCTTTYWLGGQEIPILGRGYKWIRRFMLPAGLLLGLLTILQLQGMLGGNWLDIHHMGLRAMVATTCLVAALHLGYQNKVWKYIVVGLAMGAPAIIVNFHWTFLLPAVCQGGLGYASLKDNRLMWCLVALTIGLSLGIAYIVPAVK